MNRLLLAGSALILLAGCSTHAKRAGNDALGVPAPCLAEVQGTEDGACLQVVRLSGNCGSSDAAHAEHRWLDQYYPGWVIMYQEHLSSGRDQPSSVEDHLHIRAQNGMEWDFCFDVSMFR